MANSQAKAEAKIMRRQAQASRDQAGKYAESGYQQAGQMVRDSNQFLSQNTLMLAKIGALGSKSTSQDIQNIETGQPIADAQSKELTTAQTQLETEKATLIAMQDEAKKEAEENEHVPREERGSHMDRAKSGLSMRMAERKVADLESKISAMTQGMDKLTKEGNIDAGDTANLARGSSAFTMKSLQDQLTNELNTYVSNLQGDISSAIESADIMDAQAKNIIKASEMNTMTSILGTVGGFALSGAVGGLFATGDAAGKFAWDKAWSGAGTGYLLGRG